MLKSSHPLCTLVLLGYAMLRVCDGCKAKDADQDGGFAGPFRANGAHPIIINCCNFKPVPVITFCAFIYQCSAP